MGTALNMSQWNFGLVPQNALYWMLILAIKINPGSGMPPLYLLTPIRRTVGISTNFLKRQLVLRAVTRDKCVDPPKAWAALQSFIMKWSIVDIQRNPYCLGKAEADL